MMDELTINGSWDTHKLDKEQLMIRTMVIEIPVLAGKRKRTQQAESLRYTPAERPGPVRPASPYPQVTKVEDMTDETMPMDNPAPVPTDT
jgi:hypothetical protein